MAKDLELSATQDLIIADGDLSIATDGAEVAQNWRIRILWLLGEWYYNTAIGMPWFSKIFRLTASPIAKRQYIIDCTNSTPGVRVINSIKQTTDAHIGNLEMEIETDYNTNEVLSV